MPLACPSVFRWRRLFSGWAEIAVPSTDGEEWSLAGGRGIRNGRGRHRAAETEGGGQLCDVVAFPSQAQSPKEKEWGGCNITKLLCRFTAMVETSSGNRGKRVGWLCNVTLSGKEWQHLPCCLMLQMMQVDK